MPTLQDAISLAVEAHSGQIELAGQPYILHPLRVMLRFNSEDERIVAVLHDVIEDTQYTLDDLTAMGYSKEILAALDGLTKREAETYEQFIERLEPNDLARRVKIADLEDNMDIRRLPDLTERDFERLKRYLAAWKKLNGRTE